MDFLKPEVRNYFFHQYPDIYSKVDDLPPAKYNPGSEVSNSLVSSGLYHQRNRGKFHPV